MAEVPNLVDLHDMVALVTGGSSGVGKASALSMTRLGARLALVSDNPKELQEAIQDIKAEGGEAVAFAADVSTSEEVQAACQYISDHLGRLDIVFANAGINGVGAPLSDLKIEEWDETIVDNLRGTFLTIKFKLPLLKKKGGSTIITSSVNGTRMFSNTGASAYATSKAAQVAFGKMISLELAPHHIRVNVICPGATMTEIDDNTTKRTQLKWSLLWITLKAWCPLPMGRFLPRNG